MSRPGHDDDDVGPGEWWACDFPERPPSHSYTLYGDDCAACDLALAVLVAREGDFVLYQFDGQKTIGRQFASAYLEGQPWEEPVEA